MGNYSGTIYRMHFSLSLQAPSIKAIQMHLIYVNDTLIWKQKSFEHLDKKIGLVYLNSTRGSWNVIAEQVVHLSWSPYVTLQDAEVIVNIRLKQGNWEMRKKYCGDPHRKLAFFYTAQSSTLSEVQWQNLFLSWSHKTLFELTVISCSLSNRIHRTSWICRIHY